MASTLTGIFAPGSPALVESLRTLVLEPSRAAGPGDMVRATFSFSNLGGAPATGVRVRFSHPQGVEHIAEADVVDDAPVDGATSFTDSNGAAIGDLAPNAQRRVSCTFRINDTIEDGSELLFQAALVTDQTPLIGSNIERLTVHSRPQLQSTGTLVTIAAAPAPKPGDVITVRATVINSGSSSAHDVTLVVPSPEHTTYVARSARIDGRIVPNVDGEAFDYDSSAIVSERLAPGQSVLVEYQSTIDSPLADGTRIKALGSVGSRESSEFAIVSAEIVVASPVDFEGEETGLTVLSDDVVTPGMRVPMLLRAMNTGTGIAERVQLAFTLPAGLIYAPGSAHVDGQPVGDDAIAGLVFSVGSIPAGRMAEVGIAATVAVPIGGDTALPIESSVRWRNGERRFTRRLSVRVAPRFSRARNFVEADRGVAQARDDIQFTVHVYNDGTAPETNVRLRLIPGLYLEDVRIAEESDESAEYDAPLTLGLVEPHRERIFTIRAKIGSRVPDRSNVALGAVLEHDAGAVDLGTATVVVRSRPSIERVVWELATQEALRPNRMIDVVVRVTNGGTDVLRDARLALTLPPELAVERAVEARRDREGLSFQDVPAETTHEARITLRLLRAVPQGRTLTIDGWLMGKGINPVHFETLSVPTFAEAHFAQGTHLVAIPSETVNSGERMFYEIRIRNDGDGPAERLIVRVVPTNLAVYVPSSTTINTMAIADDSGRSQLWSQRGMVLADVNPGIELRIRWEMMVMSPLTSGTPLDTRAVLEWGDGKTLAVAAPTVLVQAQPSLGESTTGTPISIARIFAAETPVYEAAPLPPPETAAPAIPAREEEIAPPKAIADVIARQAESLEALPVPQIVSPEPEPLPSPVLYADFSFDRLTNTVRMLERSDAGGLVQHLFAMRMLFPEHAAGASPQLSGTFATASRALRAPLEKLFVRLRMPRLSITGKDIEDRESRDALRNLIDDLMLAPSGSPSAPPDGFVRVEGAVDLDVVRSFVTELEVAPLGAVTPWLINAQLLGSTLYYDGQRSDSLERYRTELLSVFSVLAELPMMEFHRVLTSSVNRTLDESLAAVLDALRGAAHIGVE